MTKGKVSSKSQQKSTDKQVKINQDESVDWNESPSEERKKDKPKQKVIKKTDKKVKEKISQRSSSSDNSSVGLKSERRDSSESKISLSNSVSDSQSEQQEKKYKLREKGIKDLIEVEASSSSGSQSSEITDQQIAVDRKQQKQYYQTLYKTNEKRQTEKLMDRLNEYQDQDIDKHYKQRIEEEKRIEKGEVQDMTRRDDQDVFQIKCVLGMESQVVGNILNKAKFAAQHPQTYFCKVTAAISMPKKFPGYIFLEAENHQDLLRSIEGFKYLKITTLRKIEFELYTTLFNPPPTPNHSYKLQQYVRIKVGLYRDDLGQITKINKKGVVVQVVPRIDFKDINRRMKQIEIEYGKLNYKQNQIARLKNTRFRELTDPKILIQGQKPQKQKLTPADFQPFTEFYHLRSIRITADGLLLVNYLFQDIQYPKTTVSPLEILALNRSDVQKIDLIKQQAKKIKIALDVKKCDLVQIIHGELKGIFGKVHQRNIRTIRIKCENKELKDVIIDEITDYVEKRFKEGESVIIVQGSYKGEEGEVIRNGVHSVVILTSNKQRIKVLKSNVHVKLETHITFKNDLGIVKDDIVKTKFEMGIVCQAKKNYVDFVTPKNQIKRGMNNDIIRVTNYRSRGVTKDGEELKRGSLVLLLTGMKKQKVLLIKHIYDNNLFLKDPDEVVLRGNWVERGENCRLFLKGAPRIQAKFLQDQRKFIRFRNENPQQKKMYFNNIANNSLDDPFRVGKQYLITQGIFKGVRGVIVATFKNYIDVCVFNDRVESVSRQVLNKGFNTSSYLQKDDNNESRNSGFLTRAHWQERD